MPTLPAVVTLLLPFDLFDPRTWRKAQLLAMGAILSPGKRTVSSALNILARAARRLRRLSPRAQPRPMVAAATERALLLMVVGRLGSSTVDE